MIEQSGREASLDLMRFLDASPTPYHAVQEAVRRLESAGFSALDEREEWRLSPDDLRYLIRAGGTLVAFAVGAAPPSRAGFRLAAAHTDSPNFRVKPRSDSRAQGHRQLVVEVYGSPLLHTWLDRDLSLAGRVSLIDGSTHLVRFDRPICRISSLAIHLSPTLATDGLRLNPQQHMLPTLSLGDDDGGGVEGLVAVELGARGAGTVPREAVVAVDLMTYDVQGAASAGVNGELLTSARLDNLASSHAALTALLTRSSSSDATRGIVLYDHEEVGSQSAAGAGSLFLRSVLTRVANGMAGAGTDAAERAFARSLLVSADMAHAIHPNHADKHDPQNAPRLGGGPVLKVNVNQSYATDAPGAAVFERACREFGFSAQRFSARNDMRCGSTIGPIAAARLGMRTVDVGNPMLSMHSCREVTAMADVPKMILALKGVLDARELPGATA
ncbi:MAG TPA: M18 family aminopeptidase [Polyangiaceae bacterium]|jgi:aspartyl aminopeptidase|nr:M18 family aminopeptidase [Polyangiaceae bacterium]